jgi:hypothetical protein
MAGGFVRSELTFSLVLTAAMLTDLMPEGKGLFKMKVDSQLARWFFDTFFPAKRPLTISKAWLIAMGN